MSAFVAPGVSTGITIAATTQSAFTAGLPVIDATLPSQKVKALPSSNMGTVGGETFLAGKLKNNGELKLKVQNKVDLDPATYLGVTDTWTITFPKSPSTATTAATAAFSGFLKEYNPAGAPIDGIFEADIVIQVSGNITFTAQS
jgi:hypothetical protein